MPDEIKSEMPPEEEAGKKRKGQRRKARIDLSKVAQTAQTPQEPPTEPQKTAEPQAQEPSPEPPQPAATEPEQAPQEIPAASAEQEESSEGEEAPEGTISDLNLRAAVEAIIFAADEPVTPAAIAKAIGGVKPSAVKKAIEDIKAAREATHSGILLEEIAGGYTFLTREEFAPAIRRLRKADEGRKLTAAALETLAVIAYKQPIQKQEIEDIRGVSCGPMLRTLMELDLVKVVGRAEVLGRPLLYGTTKKFLDVFGLASLKDLPKMSELAPG